MQPCFLFVDEQGINSSDVVTSRPISCFLFLGFTERAEGLK